MDLKLNELADLLSVPEKKVQDWLSLDRIPYYRMGDEYRFNQEEIENWIFNNRGLLELERSHQEAVDSSHLKYGLYKAIHRGTVFSGISAEHFIDVFQVVCDYMSSTFNMDRQVLLEMLVSREEMMSTGLGGGMAVPHARDFFLPTHYNVVIVVFLQKSIDFRALDGVPVDTLFFLFASDDRNHLNLLSKLAHLSSDLAYRSLFKTQPSKESLLNAIKNWEGQLNRS